MKKFGLTRFPVGYHLPGLIIIMVQVGRYKIRIASCSLSPAHPFPPADNCTAAGTLAYGNFTAHQYLLFMTMQNKTLNYVKMVK